MPEITLYLAKGACSLACHLLLEELGVPYTTVIMTYTPGTGLEAADGTLSHAEYRKIHPGGFVPALRADDEIITESPAILGYIASLAPERHLMGKTALENARVTEWLTHLAGTLHGFAFNMIAWPERFADGEENHTHTQAKGRAAFISGYSRIEKALEKREFPVGDAESLVDYYLIPFYHWAAKLKIDTSPYPNYAGLVRRLEAKDSARKVLADESVTPA